MPASVPTCLASQLDVQYRGSQGGAGNWISAFWVANPSGTPCALRSSVTVELLDDQGNNRTATLAIGSPILLSAMGSMPPPGQDPAPGQLLADVALEWPTEANAVLGLGGTGTRCPLPLFQPQSARVTFAGAQPVVVGQLSNAGPAPSGSVGSICGSDVRIFDVSSLTAPELP